MLFRIRHHDKLCLNALRAAISTHRPAAVRDLLNTYGERTFARALVALSERARDDALSMLAPQDRIRLRAALPCAFSFKNWFFLWRRQGTVTDVTRRGGRHA